MSFYPNTHSVNSTTMTYRQLAKWMSEMTDKQLDMPAIIYDGDFHQAIEIQGVCRNSRKDMDSPLSDVKSTQHIMLMELISV